MAGRSPDSSRSSGFSRGRLVVGLALVALVASGAAYGLGRLRADPGPGRVVYANERGVFTRELATGADRRVGTLPKDTLQVWPDDAGRYIGYLRRGGSLWLLDLESDERWQVAERLSVGLGWSPDGRFVAGELLSDRDLVAIDPRERGTDLLAQDYAGERPLWIDSDKFLSNVGDTLVMVDIADRSSINGVAEQMRPLAISPDGREVLYTTSGTENPRVGIADLDGPALRRHREIFQGLAYRAAVSSQGFIAFSGRDKTNAGGTWVVESDRRVLRVDRQQAESIAWSQDGSAVVFVIDGTLYGHDVKESRRIRLSARGTYVRGFAVVP